MPAQIAAILAHELVHAAVGIPAGHGKAFKRAALGLGLVGPMRATTPGEAFLAAIAPILESVGPLPHARLDTDGRSEEHTSELQSLMRISYAVFCLKKKKKKKQTKCYYTKQNNKHTNHQKYTVAIHITANKQYSYDTTRTHRSKTDPSHPRYQTNNTICFNKMNTHIPYSTTQ